LEPSVLRWIIDGFLSLNDIFQMSFNVPIIIADSLKKLIFIPK